MIEIFRSRRMILLVAILIIICTIIILIEEWFTNNQPVPNTADLLIRKKSNSEPNPVKFANNFSVDVDVIDLRKSHIDQLTDWRGFLSFFSLTTFIGSISGLLVRYRQQQLRFKSLARFRNDRDFPITPPKASISTSSKSGDESCHALIDMSNHTY